MKSIKAYIINSILSCLPMVLWFYMLLFFFFVSEKWYLDNYKLIDLIDTPFYIISALHLAFCLVRCWWFKDKYYTKFYNSTKYIFLLSVFLLLLIKTIYIELVRIGVILHDKNHKENYETYKICYIAILSLPPLNQIIIFLNTPKIKFKS